MPDSNNFQQPQVVLGKPVLVKYPTPLLSDRVFSITVDSRKADYKVPTPGDSPDPGVLDPDGKLSNFVFATATPTDQIGFVQHWYLAERANEDSYNYTTEYPWVSPLYPRVTRSYITLRSKYAAPASSGDDPIFSNLSLVEEKQVRSDDPVVDSIFVAVQRVYERLPASVDYSTAREDAVISYQMRTAVPEVTVVTHEEGPATGAPIEVEHDDWRIQSQMVSAFKRIVTRVKRILPVGGKTLTRKRKLTSNQQLATVTESWKTGNQTITPRATLLDADIEDIGQDTTIKTETEVDEVFPENEYSAEIADLVPPEFRDLVPVRTTALTFEGTAGPPALATGELSKSERQTTEFIKHTSVTGRDPTALPVTRLDYELGEDFGFGGVFEVEKTLATTTLVISEGIGVADSEVRAVGGGINLRKTRAITDSQPELNLTAGGSSYLVAPIVSFTGGTGSGASATATLGRAVASITVGNAGSGYKWPPAVQITGGLGGGAAAVAVLGFGVGVIEMLVKGSGYTSAPTVGITGGGGTGATASVVRGYGVASVTVTNSGSGYTIPPSVNFSGGAGSGATATTRLGYGVESVTITGTGSGYTTAPTVVFTGDGEDAEGTANLGYPVDTLVLDDGGADYESPPAVVIDGDGSGATAIAVIGFDIDSITLDDPGSGYTSAPDVDITGGGGTGATATADFTSPTSDDLIYVSDGDDNGAFYFLGALGNGGTWQNPHTNGDIVASASSLQGGTVTAVVNRDDSDTYTTSVANSWFAFDLGVGRSLQLTDWAYKTRSADTTSLPIDMKIQGSNNGTDWTDLDAQTGLAFTTTNEWALFTLGAASAGYRHFRVMQTAQSTNSNDNFSVGEIELYGTLDIEGVITGITLTAPGSGYTSAPTVEFTGDGADAAATAVLETAGPIKELTLTASGNGYTIAPTVSFVGGPGSGADAHTTLSTTDAVVVSVTVDEPGSGYTTAPVISFTGGGGTGAAADSALEATGSVKNVVITNAGTGYTSAPAVSFPGGDGTGAAATSVLGTIASIVGITVTAAGTGYTSAPTIAISGGSGSGATARAILAATGVVKSILVTHGGSRFRSVPAVAFLGGQGSGATATAVLAASGSVIEITLSADGSYTVAPTVVFTPVSAGPGSGAAAVYVLGSERPWPVLYESETDPVQGIVVNMVKRIVPAGTRHPGDGSYTDIKALDKWRSVQIVSSIDVSTIPPPEKFGGMWPLALPDTLLAIEVVWRDSQSHGGSRRSGFVSIEASNSTDASIHITTRSGYRGDTFAEITRTYFFGPPNLENIPAPTIIQPVSGTAAVLAINTSLSKGLHLVNIGDSSGSHGSQFQQVAHVDIRNVLTGNYRLIGNLAQPIAGFGYDDELSGGAGGVDPSTHTANPVVAGDPLITSQVISEILIPEPAIFKVRLPRSTPSTIIPGEVLTFIKSVEKWRFGVWVVEIAKVIVPEVSVLNY